MIVACFIADRMVDRLGRWLRLLGEDVGPAPASSAELVQAAAQGRVVLTRDTRLRARLRAAGLPHLFVADDRLDDQLRQVDREYGLGRHAPLTRCSRCNAPLVFAGREQVHGAVWPHVERAHERFGRCPSCGRIYWQASHFGRMRAFVVRALGRDLLGSA